MNLRVLFLLVLSFAVSIVSYGQDTSNKMPVNPVSSVSGTMQNYLLGPGDVVEGKVLGEQILILQRRLIKTATSRFRSSTSP
jgi:protein involved in polysaccharide export with SLBB domain